jgi:hypothetical protein
MPPVTDTDIDATSDMIRQAAAMAVQDAVSHMRNVNIIAAAALGAAQEMILDDVNVDGAKVAIAAVQSMVAAAADNFVAVSMAAGKVIGETPPAGKP